MTQNKRNNFSILPDTTELAKIIEIEVKREVPKEKINIHYPDFSTIIKLFEKYNLPTKLFCDDTLDIFGAVSQGKILVDQAIPAILTRKNDELDIKLFDDMYDYLTEEDQPEKSDFIFTFGSKTPFRAEKALELYYKGLSKKIIISGGNPIYGQQNSFTESQSYKEILLSGGVLENDIIIEDKSITVPDNIRRSLNLLDELKISYNSFILVNSPYVQRRGWAVFKKYLPSAVNLYRVNSKTAPEFLKGNWYKQEKTLRVIFNEFIKMRSSVVYGNA